MPMLNKAILIYGKPFMPVTKALTLPAQEIPLAKAPGHWVLVRLGKRVLRPGGLEATNLLLRTLQITGPDHVVEFAPGMGATASRLLDRRPASYTGVERDEAAAARLRTILGPRGATIVLGSAESSGLRGGQADVLVGEAMLTMQPVERKRAIIAEAARLLRPGGRYGIHEIALGPEDVSEKARRDLRANMSKVIHHGVTPQTESEWRGLLAEAGFTDLDVHFVPFRLLEPKRLVADEGLFGAARFVFNLLRMPDARRRVLEMRRTFRRYEKNLSAIVITARKQ